MIKVDLHLHSGEDPYDGLRYPATALIDRAAALGFGAIAITLHQRVLDEPRLFDHARQRGVLLIRGVEWTIEGADVLLYNVSQAEAERLRRFADLEQFRRARGEDLLVVAPHPYYPMGHALRHRLEQHIELFDAIEYAHVHLPWLNHNHRARRVARQYGKPLVANSDAHNLWMFGRTYTLVDSEPQMLSVFQAIRERRIQWHSPHMTVAECVRFYLIEPCLMRRHGRTVESFPSS